MAASREQQFQATPSCCVACWPLTQSWKSDLKRQLIGFISYALKGESAPEFRLPTVGLPRPSPSGRLLSEAQEIEYNFLLAKLREAEGCSPDTLIAERDLLAATKLGYLQPMYEKTEATKNMIFLEAARCIDIWYQKGLKLEQKYYGPEHDQVREGEAAWAKIWSQIHCLQVLRLSSVVKVKNRSSYISSKSGEEFAVLINNENFTMTLLSRDEVAVLIAQRLKKQRG